jgi:ubiquinone/menaquinone biosynthesis C-methylase UbiE
MQTASKPVSGEYSLVTGEAAVRRLRALHQVYSPTGRRVLLQAGLKEGMRVADIGCGVGMVTRMLAEMVGPSGSVVGIDMSAPQLEQARQITAQDGLKNVTFVEASACATGLPKGTFDLVYCRFLLLHLTDPADCLREMGELLKPGEIILVEDGDLTTGGSVPHTALGAFADLFGRLGPTRGVDYTLAKNLYPMVMDAGFSNVEIEIHQPAMPRGETRNLLHWTIEEAGPACVAAGLLSDSELKETLTEMKRAVEDLRVLVLAPRMSLVWARKAVN